MSRGCNHRRSRGEGREARAAGRGAYRHAGGGGGNEDVTPERAAAHCGGSVDRICEDEHCGLCQGAAPAQQQRVAAYQRQAQRGRVERRGRYRLDDAEGGGDTDVALVTEWASQ